MQGNHLLHVGEESKREFKHDLDPSLLLHGTVEQKVKNLQISQVVTLCVEKF